MENNFSNSLDADKSVLLLVDYQRSMFYGVESGDRTSLKNNVIGLAKGAGIIKIPTILTTIGMAKNGAFFHEITAVFPGQEVIDRTLPVFDALSDPAVDTAVKNTGRKQLVLSGLWTSMCFAHTALHALRSGYHVFGVVDTAGSESLVAHDIAIQRMIQAGVVPVTWEQVVVEWMKTWASPQAAQLSKEVYSVYNGYMGMR